MCNSGTKNRTPKEAFDFLKKQTIKVHDSTTLGIGLFVVPAPENGILEYKVVPVAGISYKECLKRGTICESYQWVPKGYPAKTANGVIELNSIEDVKKIKLDCNSIHCPTCPYGCTCFDSDAVCNENSY